jgi:hypothetical protein
MKARVFWDVVEGTSVSDVPDNFIRNDADYQTARSRVPENRGLDSHQPFCEPQNHVWNTDTR